MQCDVMWKIDVECDGHWIERDSTHRFGQDFVSGQQRLKVVLPLNRPTLVRDLAAGLAEPFQHLYVLHTSRGEGELGRYQSPELGRAELDWFLMRFSSFLCGDARHDLWLRSAASNAMIVWDRHNDICLYGDANGFAEKLEQHGLQEGEIANLGEHLHHYRAEYDRDARAVFGAFVWQRTPLQVGDEQYVPPAASVR